jgi:hypothetical protein
MNGLLVGLNRRFENARDDSGVALVTVIGIGMMLTLLMFATTGFAVNQLKQVHNDQDWNAALAAAQAGVDDYVSKISADGTYYQYGDKTNPYSAASNVTLPTGTKANPAFVGWTPIPGTTSTTTGQTRAFFRYEVDTTLFTGVNGQGIIKLRSSGKVGNRVRTVEVQVAKRGFTDYMYFTEYDTKDPALYDPLYGDPLTSTQAGTQCAKHKYDGRVDDSSHCVTITFGGGDTINGPLHSNDSFYACDVTFKGRTTSSWNDAAKKFYITNGSGCSTVFSSAGSPTYADKLTMPPSNSSLRQQVDPTYANPVGCLYTGPTSIVLNAAGTMNVQSPWTKNGGAAYCGVGNNLTLPGNGVIIVQNVPAVADAYTQSTPTSPCVGSANPLGYPIATDVSKYDCRAGDLFIEGTLKGQLTASADNNVIVTWHIDYAGGAAGNDLLGLIANNNVEIYHPVKCTSFSGSTCTAGTNLNAAPNHTTAVFTASRVNAAMLSLQHCFRVQNYRWGAQLGALNVTGAIAQQYRGIVALSGTSGFTKNYVYDSKLRYASPPYFLDPVQSAYGPKTWSELNPAY